MGCRVGSVLVMRVIHDGGAPTAVIMLDGPRERATHARVVASPAKA